MPRRRSQHATGLTMVALLLVATLGGLAACERETRAEGPPIRGVHWTKTGKYSGVAVWLSEPLEIRGAQTRIVSVTSHVAGNPRPLLASTRYVSATGTEPVSQEAEFTKVVARPKDGLAWGQVANRQHLSVELEGYP